MGSAWWSELGLGISNKTSLCPFPSLLTVYLPISRSSLRSIFVFQFLTFVIEISLAWSPLRRIFGQVRISSHIPRLYSSSFGWAGEHQVAHRELTVTHRNLESGSIHTSNQHLQIQRLYPTIEMPSFKTSAAVLATALFSTIASSQAQYTIDPNSVPQATRGAHEDNP